MLQYKTCVDKRLARELFVERARASLFGHKKGMPGERWWTRPLMARQMLHWYMPSKFGLQEFQLDQYYEMQAERFKKRPQSEWLNQFREISEMVHRRKGKISSYLGSLSEEEFRMCPEAQDLRAIFTLTVGQEEEAGKQILRFSLLRDRHKDIRESACTRSKESYSKTRHRFVDPLFRRRRLKWMERFLAGMNNPTEIKLNRHYTRHPDEQPKWPSNLGSVTMKTHLSISPTPIDSVPAVEFVTDPECGAVSTFLGITRSDLSGSQRVHALEFEAHEPLALAVLNKIVSGYRQENPDLHHVFIQHRIGRVPVGETNIILGVSSKHRKCAFKAIEALMGLVKQQLPVWKKEIYLDQTYRWIENTEFTLSFA